MGSHQRVWGLVRALAALCLFVWAPYGCSVVGPLSISQGRGAYNEAIRKTNNEQILMYVVLYRYGETSTLLAVSSVTANLRFAGNIGAEAGIGSELSYAGNLTPVSAGIAYEENPTIAYTPVQGERYLRKLLSPIPLDLLLMLVRTSQFPSLPIKALVNRINDVQNPDFLVPPLTAPDPRFMRFLELMTDFNRRGLLLWAKDPQVKAGYLLVIRGYAPAHTKEARELLAILGLQGLEDERLEIVIPVSLTIAKGESCGIGITTRSVRDLLEILAASIDVPEEHTSSGLAIDYPPLGLAGKDIRIHRAQTRPGNATVRVQYRGMWFYIEETDMQTKQFFRMLSSLWDARMAEAVGDVQAAPVLTVPVSR